MSIETANTTTAPDADPERFGIDPAALARLYERIEAHIAAGRYPGAAVAMARHGEIVAARSFGHARLADGSTPGMPATDETLWLLYSQTKPVISSAIWQLVERGHLRFQDRVAEYVPEFAQHGKERVTLFQVLTHQGGFPHARAITPALWEDHAALRAAICDFTLEWEPGARVVYHGAAAPLGPGDVNRGGHWARLSRSRPRTRSSGRSGWIACASACRTICTTGSPTSTTRARAATRPSRTARIPPRTGGPGSPAGVATPRRAIWRSSTRCCSDAACCAASACSAPRMVQYATRNHTDERIDEAMGMPMHRGLGVHVRGTTPAIRGLGSIASPSTFGHGGAGTSYSWADPETGVSFTYLTNGRVAEPWHSQRLDEIAVLAHAAVIEP